MSVVFSLAAFRPGSFHPGSDGFGIADCFQDLSLEAERLELMGNLAHHAKQLCLQDKLALLVFLARLIRLVVFPSYGLLALPADYISYHMAAGRHTSLHRLRLVDIDDVIEEERLAMLSAEILSRYM